MPSPGAATWEDALHEGGVRGFPTYDEANSLLEGWRSAHPDLLVRQPIGESVRELPIYGYSLGLRTNARTGLLRRPQLLLTALTHAREPAGLTVLLYFLGRVLELRGLGDPEATYLLAARQAVLVPFVNPDGYIANEKRADKSVRKNQRQTCRENSAENGVDINRNFGVHWGGSFGPCDEEFQGKAPFSEPEAQALRHACEANSFRAAMNFHAYGGMLTHPYNWAMNERLPDDVEAVYSEIGEVFGWSKSGPAIQTVGYTTSGEMDDWMYKERDIIAMSPEVGPEGGSFWPPPREILGISRRNFARILYVAHKTGCQLRATWGLGSPGFPRRSAGDAADGTDAAGAVLELEVRNNGLSDSGGERFGVAVSWQSGHGDPQGANFSTRPIGKRTDKTLLLQLRTAVPAELTSGSLRVCFAEDVWTEALASGRNWTPSCHCFGGQSPDGQASRESGHWLRARSSGPTGEETLCGVAVSAASRRGPIAEWAVPNGDRATLGRSAYTSATGAAGSLVLLVMAGIPSLWAVARLAQRGTAARWSTAYRPARLDELAGP